MAKVVHRRFLTDGKVAWPLNNDEVGQKLDAGIYNVPEGWIVVHGLPMVFFEPYRRDMFEAGELPMEEGYCMICGGHTIDIVEMPSGLLRDLISEFPSEWENVPVCARRGRCIDGNKKIEKTILEYRLAKAKEKRGAQRAAVKRGDGGLGEEPASSGETDGTMPVRGNGLVAPGEEREDNNLELSEVPSGS